MKLLQHLFCDEARRDAEGRLLLVNPRPAFERRESPTAEGLMFTEPSLCLYFCLAEGEPGEHGATLVFEEGPLVENLAHQDFYWSPGQQFCEVNMDCVPEHLHVPVTEEAASPLNEIPLKLFVDGELIGSVPIRVAVKN